MKRNYQRVGNLTGLPLVAPKGAKWGFTLVEILVVLAIMSIIISLTLISLNSIRPKNRDMKRISDIGHLQEALEMYKRENYVYPVTTAVVAGLPLIGPNGVTYMKAVPTSPGYLDGSCTADSYTYAIQNSGLSYTIQYCLGGAAKHLSAGNLMATPGQLGAPVASASSVPSYYPASGMLAYWPMDGNSNDLYGSYNGTDHSMSYVADGSGQAASFGGSSYIDYGDVLDMGTNSQTINFWMKTGTTPTTYTGIVCKSKYASEVGRYWIDAGGNATGHLEAGCANGAVDTHINKLYTYYDNTWHMVTGLWDRSGNMSLYVDNEYFTGTSISAFSASNWQTADKLFFGVYNDTNGTSPKAGTYFNGRLDEISFYNRALTTAEMKTIFENQKTTYFTSPTGTIANWQFEGNANDSVGSYTGTAAGVTYAATGTGQSVIFAGTSGSYVSVTSNANLYTKPFTYCTWINLDTNNTVNTIIGYNTGPNISFRAKSLHLETVNTNTAIVSQSADCLTVGAWYHVCMTYKNNGATDSIAMYANGVSVKTDSPSAITPSGGTMYIGKHPSQAEYFKGKMDEFRFYNHALTATEVLNLYNLTKGNY